MKNNAISSRLTTGKIKTVAGSATVAATIILLLAGVALLFIPLMPVVSAESPYTLEFEAVDYDNKNEVSIIVNGQTVTSLPTEESPQNNNDRSEPMVDVGSFLIEGVNTLTFQQNTGWSAHHDLTIHYVFSNENSKCLWQPSRTSWTYTFYFSEKPYASYHLEWEGYDFDTRDEVTITLNGQVVDVWPGCSNPEFDNNGWGTINRLQITPFVVEGTNTLTFTDNTGSAKIKNVVISKYVWDAVNGRQLSDVQVILSDSGERSISKTSKPSTTYTFQTSSQPTYTLEWEGYDYDSKQEVTVTLNGQVIGTLPSTWVSANNDVWRSFSINNLQLKSTDNNVLTFTQNLYSSKIRNLVIKDPSGNTVYSSAEQRSTWLPSKPSTTYTFNLP